METLTQLIKEKHLAAMILNDAYQLEHIEMMEPVFQQLLFVCKWRKRNIEYHYQTQTEEFYSTDRDFMYRAFLARDEDTGKYLCHMTSQNNLKYKL